MKNSLSIIFIIYSLSSFAQPWIEQGATWHYSWINVSNYGFRKIEYTQDTLIQNKTCQMLVVENHTFERDQFQDNYLGGGVIDTNYTYSKNDTVFWLINETFHILYDFNADVGDSWDLGFDTNEYKCSKSYTVVDSIGTIEINGKTLRWVALNWTKNSSVGFFEQKIIEGIGGMRYLFPTFNNCDSTTIVHFQALSFRCFQDDLFTLYPNNVDCDAPLHVNKKINNSLFNIYPNPSKGNLVIENFEGRLTVFSVYGDQLATHQISNRKNINFEGFPGGVYLLQFENETTSFSKKWILE